MTLWHWVLRNLTGIKDTPQGPGNAMPLDRFGALLIQDWKDEEATATFYWLGPVVTATSVTEAWATSTWPAPRDGFIREVTRAHLELGVPLTIRQRPMHYGFNLDDALGADKAEFLIWDLGSVESGEFSFDRMR